MRPSRPSSLAQPPADRVTLAVIRNHRQVYNATGDKLFPRSPKHKWVGTNCRQLQDSHVWGTKLREAAGTASGDLKTGKPANEPQIVMGNHTGQYRSVAMSEGLEGLEQPSACQLLEDLLRLPALWGQDPPWGETAGRRIKSSCRIGTTGMKKREGPENSGWASVNLLPLITNTFLSYNLCVQDIIHIFLSSVPKKRR